MFDSAFKLGSLARTKLRKLSENALLNSGCDQAGSPFLQGCVKATRGAERK